MGNGQTKSDDPDPPVLAASNVSHLVILKNLGSREQMFDLVLLKQVISFRTPELWLRLSLMGIGSLALLGIFDDAIPLLYFGFHALLAIVFRLYLNSLSSRATARQYLFLACIDLLSVSGYAGAILYFGMTNTDSYQVLAMIMFAGFFLHSLGERSRVLFLLINDIATQMVVLTSQIAWLWTNLGTGDDGFGMTQQEVAILTVGAIALQLYFLLLCRNVRQARHDLQEAQERRVADERLLAIGQLSGGIAHDFNNMLTAVLGNIELLRLTSNPLDRETLLDEAEKAARHGAELTTQLLAYSRKAQLRPRSMKISDLVMQCLQRSRKHLAPGQTLAVKMRDRDLPPVYLDPSQFCTALASLIDNAARAMDDNGHLVIHCTPSTSLGRKGVMIEVRDNGRGISSEIRPLVFEPYFTTRPKGQGTGLGLSMAEGIVEQSGGRLELTSEEGKGTSVFIHLPAHDSEQSL